MSKKLAMVTSVNNHKALTLKIGAKGAEQSVYKHHKNFHAEIRVGESVYIKTSKKGPVIIGLAKQSKIHVFYPKVY